MTDLDRVEALSIEVIDDTPVRELIDTLPGRTSMAKQVVRQLPGATSPIEMRPGQQHLAAVDLD